MVGGDPATWGPGNQPIYGNDTNTWSPKTDQILENSIHGSHEANDEHAKTLFLMAFIFLMLFFFVGAAIVEKHKPVVGHETGVTIFVGMIISYLFWLGYGNEQRHAFQFSQTAFFEFFLPPVIFNSGYTMRKKKFFNNLGNILIFGLYVTFTCFAIYSYFTWYMINEWDLM
jgi:NhaP-type Na+/H+ or K+/H+ antiporter